MNKGKRDKELIAVAILVLVLFVAGIILFDRIVLDPGGGGLARDANDACATHNGVRSIRAQEGVIICRDGWAVE